MRPLLWTRFHERESNSDALLKSMVFDLVSRASEGAKTIGFE